MGSELSIVSARIRAVDGAFAAVKDFYFTSRYGRRRGEPDICDLTFGNPHEMPLDGLVKALRERAIPKDKDWFAYKTSEEEPRVFLAKQLRRELALPFEPPILHSPPARSRRSWSRSELYSTPATRQ